MDEARIEKDNQKNEVAYKRSLCQLERVQNLQWRERVSDIFSVSILFGR